MSEINRVIYSYSSIVIEHSSSIRRVLMRSQMSVTFRNKKGEMYSVELDSPLLR